MLLLQLHDAEKNYAPSGRQETRMRGSQEFKQILRVLGGFCFVNLRISAFGRGTAITIF